MALRKKPTAPTPAPSRPGANAAKSGGRPGAKVVGKPGAKVPVKLSRRERMAGRRAKLRQLREAFSMTRKADPRVVLWMSVAFGVPLAVGVGVGIAIGSYVFLPLLGVLVGLIAALNVFGRRAQKAAYAQVEGQPGVAYGVVQSMRGDWRITPSVQFNKNQDFVHRVVGRPGVILIAEGGRGKRDLLGNEARRVKRVIGDVPLYDVVVGDAEGEVAVRALAKHLTKLPRNLKQPAVNEVDRKLKALGGASMPIPKGPMPRSIPR